jgi:hypothetical protein
MERPIFPTSQTRTRNLSALLSFAWFRSVFLYGDTSILALLLKIPYTNCAMCSRCTFQIRLNISRILTLHNLSNISLLRKVKYQVRHLKRVLFSTLKTNSNSNNNPHQLLLLLLRTCKNKHRHSRANSKAP